MINLIIYEIRSRLAAICGWGIGLVIFGVIYLTLAPELFEQLKSLTNLSVYTLVGLHLESVESYIASVILAYSSFLLGIYCIIISTMTLAGEEDNGTLELLIASPYARWKIVTSKAIALSLVVFFILIIAGTGNALALAVMKSSYPINITPFSFFMSFMGSLPLLVAFIMMGIFIGSCMPNRRIAATVMAVYFVASYFGQHLSHISKSVEPFTYLCLFYYYDTTRTIFTDGVRLSDVLILSCAAGIFFAFALIFFKRRQITAGTWPWERGKITSEKKQTL
jgi:ABC-2 type transport system permease protein